MGARWTFHAEPGFFADAAADQDDDPGAKLATQPQLGLVPQLYASDGPGAAANKRDWERFAAHVSALNRAAPDGVAYKVLYLTRHGFGVHNKKQAEVGAEEWERYWSLLDGDGGDTWFDASLTDEGIQQAHDLHAFWADLVVAHGAPLPQTIYTSPLARCLQTTWHVFAPLMAQHGKVFRPVVKEKLRERFTGHTCDLRRPRAWIAEAYPAYAVEEGFAERDPFRGRGYGELGAEHRARKQAALEEVFSSDASEVIGLTAHSLAIRSILEACNARPFKGVFRLVELARRRLSRMNSWIDRVEVHPDVAMDPS